MGRVLTWEAIVNEAIALYGDTPTARGYAERVHRKVQRYQAALAKRHKLKDAKDKGLCLQQAMT